MLVHPWFHHMVWLNEQNKHIQSGSRLAICGPEKLLSVLKGSLLIENNNIKVQRIKKESRFTLTQSLCILQVKQTESTLWNAQVSMKTQGRRSSFYNMNLLSWQLIERYFFHTVYSIQKFMTTVISHNVVMIFYLFNIPLKKWETTCSALVKKR